MIKTASREELSAVAGKLIEPAVEGLQAEMDALKMELKGQRDTIIALNTQLTAMNHRMGNELARSEKSRQAILKRLAEVENAARAVC